jgi:peroxiredoxin Q/BCP
MKLHIHQPAPNFSLPDQDGEIHKLSDYTGKWVLLYFYPKDDTPGCTKEACSLRDNFPHFQNSELTVLGISKDSITSHKKFAEKYTLPFPLLADEQKEVIQAYDVWQEKSMMGKKYMGIVRTSFLIDQEGKIAKIYEKVKPEVHVKEVLSDIQKFLQKT